MYASPVRAKHKYWYEIKQFKTVKKIALPTSKIFFVNKQCFVNNFNSKIIYFIYKNSEMKQGFTILEMLINSKQK